MLSVQVIGALSLLAAAVAQHVKVEPAVSGFVGNQVVLRCQFVDPASSVQVTQVTWVKDPSGAKQNLAVYNPKYGTSYPVDANNRIHFRAASLTDASLVIDRLLMSDEGTYSCEFSTYPEGVQQAATNLTVLAEPKITGNALPVMSGKSTVPVARCVAAAGKPPASITWNGNVPGNATKELTQNADGTTTVTSWYLAVPSSQLDGVMLQCVITQRALERPRVIDCALSIQSAVAQHVQVEPAVFGFVGNQVVLSCQFVDPDSSLEVTQVTWVKDPSGAKQKLAVRNPKYGTNYPVDTNNRIHFQDASLTDASLVIDHLLMSDEGIYSCEFAIYPKGNLEAATNLTVLAESKISGNALPVMSGKSPVPVARCVAAGGKPPASITWRGNVPGNATTELTQNADGTTTVTSWFLAVPGRQLDGVMLQCVVTQRTVEWPRVINSALSIQ